MVRQRKDKNKDTTIKISKKVLDELKTHGSMGDSIEDVIIKLMQKKK